MTKHSEKPTLAQAPKAKTDDALSDAALETISGGKPATSDIAKKSQDYLNAVASNFKP